MGRCPDSRAPANVPWPRARDQGRLARRAQTARRFEAAVGPGDQEIRTRRGRPRGASLPQRDKWSRWSKLTDDAGQHRSPRGGRGQGREKSQPVSRLRRASCDSSGEKSAKAPEAGIRKPHVDAGEPASHLAFLKRTNQGSTRVLEGRTRKRPKNWKDIYVLIQRIPNQTDSSFRN